MTERKSILSRLDYLIHKGKPMPDPIELPEWSEEWMPFGDKGAMMKQINMDGMNCTAYHFQTPPSQFGEHLHPNDESLTCVKGSGILRVWNGDDFDSIKMEAGQTYFIPKMTLHDVIFEEETYICLLFMPAFPRHRWNASQNLSTKQHNYEKS